MTDEIDHDTAWSLVVLAAAGLAIALLLWWVTAAAAGVCLTKKEARHLWPRQHIFWYSRDRCWSNRRGPPRGLHIDPIDPVFPKGAKAKAKEVMPNETAAEQFHSDRPEHKKEPRLTGGAQITSADEFNEIDSLANDADANGVTAMPPPTFESRWNEQPWLRNAWKYEVSKP